MEVFLDCLPCVLRQVLEASRLATDRFEVQEAIMEEATALLTEYRKFRNAPELGGRMHQLVKKHTGVHDPYRQVKAENIRDALRVYPFLERYLSEQVDPSDRLYWALKIAATGNIIDAAVGSEADFMKNLEAELVKPFAVCDLTRFQEELERAENLLIIGDNAGETVFDRLLMDYLSDLEITYAVRGEPVINDATVDDVRASGFDPRIKVVSTGTTTPGLILEECTEEFVTLFYQADLVISKGQGNYEALMEEEGRGLFFLLKAKCLQVAEILGVQVNNYVFKWHCR
ncbi:MAG: DUF89 family protein [Firmicutes bacterium]|nr:DUF89 family protein [Bacillota bacterium]